MLANSTSGFAFDSVNGRNRVPYPPTNIRAFMLLSRAGNQMDYDITKYTLIPPYTYNYIVSLSLDS